MAGTGSGTFYPVMVTASGMGLESRVILYPRGYRTGSFGRIYAPYHDNPPLGRNIERIHGAFVFVSDNLKPGNHKLRRFIDSLPDADVKNNR